MADSLSNKARVLGLGFLHNLLDRAIDMNSIPTLQQYERDLESAVYQLMEAQALNNARVSQIENSIAQLDSQEAILDNQIDRLLQLNREDLAGQVQTRLDELNRQEEPLVQERQTGHDRGEPGIRGPGHEAARGGFPGAAPGRHGKQRTGSTIRDLPANPPSAC